MLQSIKGSLSSPLLRYSIFGILILSFGVWGIGDVLRRIASPSQDELVEGRGIVINEQIFQNAWQRATAPFKAQGLSDEQLFAGPLPRLLLERLLGQALLQKETKRLKLDIPQKVLQNTIANNQLFANENGQFEGWRFAAFLRNTNINEQIYLEQLKHNILEENIIDSMAFGLSLPNTFIQFLIAAENEKRKIQALQIPFEHTASIQKPSDDELINFMELEAATFQLPEYRSFDILRISANQNIKFSEDTLRSEYEARKEALQTDERRSYSQIFFSDKNSAQKVINAYKKNKNLQKAAQEATQEVTQEASAPSAIVIKEKTKKEIIEDTIANTVFSLENIGDADIVEGSLGWYIIRLDKLIPAKIPEFKDVRNKIKKLLEQEQAVEQFNRDIEQAEDAILTGASLNEVAETIGQKLVTTEMMNALGQAQKITRNNKSKQRLIAQALAQDGVKISEVEEEELRKIGFSISTIGEATQGFELENLENKIITDVLFLQLKKIQDARVEKLDSANRERVLKTYKNLKILENAQIKADEIAKNAREKSLQQVARKEKIPIQSITLQRNDTKWQEDFLHKLFQAQIDDVLITTNKQNGRHIVVKVASISRPSVSSITPDEVKKFAGEFEEQRILPLLTFQQILQERAQIRINEQAFAEFISQYQAQNTSP